MSSQDTFNPFPGLRPFQIEEKFLFFGREEQTSELLTRLRKTRFLAVVGVSGSGKSSLVRAGLLPELHGGTMATAGSSWEVAVMRPGGDPLTNLAEALIDADIHDSDEEHIASHLRATLGRSGKGLVEAIKQGDLPERTNLLLVVDQFEEIFRFRRMSGLSEEEAGHFITLLLEASEQADCPIYVVLTMRSDFLGDCAQFRGLAEAVNEGEYLIPRLNRNQRRQAIEGPVAVGGREISNRLTQRLLNDIGDDPDQLPILQHALMRTWDYWEASGAQGPLDLEHYQATGGMTEALSRHADEVHAELPDDEHRWIAEKLFKALTEKVDQHRGIRRPMQMLELCNIIERDEAKVRTVVDAFRAKGRTFLMPSGDTEITPKTVIDISHESLMRVWYTLRNWVDDEAQSAKIYRRLADTSSLYQDGKAGLYRDPDLQIALSWRDETQPNKTWADHYFAGFDEAMAFLDNSQEEAEREEREREEARQRELAQAQALAKAEQERAEAEQLRAEEQARSASRLRKMLAGLAVATCAALIFLVIAVVAKQATEEAKREVDNKILELAERSIARGDELSDQGESLKALPWYADAASLAKGDPELQQSYKTKLVQKIEQAPRLTGMVFRDTSIGHFHYSPDGSRYFVGELAEGTEPSEISFYNSSTDELIKKDMLPGGMAWAQFSDDGDILYTKSWPRTVTVWDVATGNKLHTFDKHNGWVGHKIGISSDDSLLAVPIMGVNTGIMVWDLETGEEKYPLLSTDYHCSSAAFSNDMRYLVGVTRGWGTAAVGAIYVWELSQTQPPELTHHIEVGKPAHWIDFSPNNLQIVVGFGNLSGEDGPFFAQVFDVISGRPVSERMAHASGVTKAVFSPDGQWILTGETDGMARTWNAQTGTAISDPMVHDNELFDVNFSPDGAYVATASADNTARVWNAQSGEPVTPPLLHSGGVNTVSFDEASRTITTSGLGGTGRRFVLPMEQERLKGIASQSTTGFGGDASRANDGNTDGDFWNNSVTHTAEGDPNPWWQLDLTESSKVSKIIIWNRLDSRPWRLVNFRVSVADESGGQLWSKDFLTTLGALGPIPNIEIALPDLTAASIVKIEKIGPDIRGGNMLALAEVEVFKANESTMNQHELTQLNQYSKLTASSEISENGNIIELSKEKLQSNWDTLKSANFIEPSDNDLSDWHRLRAKRLHGFQHWSGFLYHLHRMSDTDRNSPDFSYMEATAYAELGDFEKAFQLHSAALQKTPNDLKIIWGYIGICAHLNKVEQGRQIVEHGIESFLDDQDALNYIAVGSVIYPELFKDVEIPIELITKLKEERPGYVDLGDASRLRLTEAITIEGWIHSPSGSGLISKGGSYFDDGYALGIRNGDVRFYLSNSQTQESTRIVAPMPSDSDWNHLAATWDSGTNEMTLYINGVKQDQVGFFNGPIGVSDQRLNLSRNERWFHRYCSAGYSDIRLWSFARSEEAIKATMNERLSGDESGLVGYWPFSEDEETVALNKSPNGADGIVINPAWPTTKNLPFSEDTTYCDISTGDVSIVKSLTLEGVLHYRLGDIEQAVKVFESARVGGARRPENTLKPDDGDETQWLLLAQCYHKIEEKEKASNLLNLAIERVTDEALNNLGWQYRMFTKKLLESTKEMLSQDSAESK